MPLLKQILIKLKDIDVKVITGQEVKTNEVIDGKRVYKKNIDCGNLPNASSKTIAIDASFTKIIKIEGLVKASGLYLPLPYLNLSATGSIQIDIRGSNIQILTSSDRSNCTATVTVYYIKD